MAKKNAISTCNCARDSMIEKRVLKRAARKALRKLAKVLLEDAPKRVTKGWWV